MTLLPPQFESVLDRDERVIWTGRPTPIPFFLSGVPFLILGLCWGAFDYFGFIRHMGEGRGLELGFAAPFFLLHLMPFWLGIGNMFRLLLVFGNTFYAFTNKRLMLRTGFWGTDFKSIDYDRIQELDVTVNPIENLLGVGSIRVFTGQTNSNGAAHYHRFVGIADPYAIYKRIKEVSVDVKTDWNYPNAIRPDTNPGYKTNYDENHNA